MRVLYATDGSSPAREGERLIASLFDPALSHIHTFSVAPEPLLLPMIDGNLEMSGMEGTTPDADQIALEASQELGKKGFTVSSSAASGDPAREILRVLERDGFDLVVLGASHTTWMGYLLLGSVSMHVLHHAPCSVVVTHRAPSGNGRILFATDGSEGAFAALEKAMNLLDRSRCAVTVATVVSQPWVSVAVYPPGPPFGSYTEYRDLEKRQVETAWQVVERTRAQLTRAGFETEGAVLQGRAGSQLLKEADSIGADLVVVGSRGLGPVRRAFLGSVGDQLVRHAPATFVGRGP